MKNNNLKMCIEHGPWLRRYGVEGACKQLKKAGFDGFDYTELCDTNLPLWNLPEDEFKAELEKVKNTALQYGLSVFQTHGPWRFPPKDYTEEDRAERFEKFAKAIRGTAYLGSRIFVIHCLMPYGAQACDDRDEFIKINADFFEKLAEVAKQYDVEIHIETLPFPKLPINSAQECVDFVKLMNKRTNSDVFRVCLDTGHCNFCGEDPAEAVRIIGKELLGSLHVHDNDGHADQHLLPYCGTINWEAFSDALIEIGYDKVFNFETTLYRNVTPEQNCDEAERELVLLGHKLAKNS